MSAADLMSQQVYQNETWFVSKGRDMQRGTCYVRIGRDLKEDGSPRGPALANRSAGRARPRSANTVRVSSGRDVSAGVSEWEVVYQQRT